MSDDSNDGSGASGRPGSRGWAPRRGVLRRALRWETFALAALLVVLALVFG